MKSNRSLKLTGMSLFYFLGKKISCGCVKSMRGMMCRVVGAGTICQIVMYGELQPTFFQSSFVGPRVHTGDWAVADWTSRSPALWTLSSGWHQGDFDRTGRASSVILPEAVCSEFHLCVTRGFCYIIICNIRSIGMPYQYAEEHH